MNRGILTGISLAIALLPAKLTAQNFYHKPAASSAILHQMEKAQVMGSVMYIAAHPDDENTRLISWLTNDRKVSVTYLSLTRGDGGQNLVGPEIREALGVIRTQELLQARQTDGGSQMFTRANDFGYSKTPEESLRIWDSSQVLADVVWAIRKARPDIIITRFSTRKREGRSTHGHHTASAILASEAFDLAGDPTAFPEQLEYVEVWQPKRLYWNTSWWFFGSEERFEQEIAENPGKYLRLEVGTFIQELGLSCSEIASLSRSRHKSQGFGSTPDRGKEFEYLELIKGESAGDLFGGIDISWKRLGLEDLAKKYRKVISQFNTSAPQASIGELNEILREVRKRKPADEFWHRQLIRQLNDLIFKCSRIYVEATHDRAMVAQGDSMEVRFRMINRVPGVTVTIRRCSFRAGEETVPVENRGENEYGFADRISLSGIPISQPYWLNHQSTEGMYHVTDQEMIGKPEADYPLFYTLEITVNGGVITKTVPVIYSTNDPVDGEVKYPLIVTPDLMVRLQRDVYIFGDTRTREVTMEIIAGADHMEGYAELNLPEGWGCEPRFHKVSLTTAGQRKVVVFKVTPTDAAFDGTLTGYFKTDTHVYGLGFQHIKYDHIPPQAIFGTCRARLVRTDIRTDPAVKKIGYIQGAGDQVPDALGLMGFDVEELDPKNISAVALEKYDAVVVGIRAYNTVEEMVRLNALLNDFTHKGGIVVIQYNTSHRLVTPEIGPYPLDLSRNRVTEEDAVVELINPESPVLSWPNKLTVADFSGWVQERGLYFPDNWSAEYQPVIRIADTGETPGEGSILVAKYGEGRFVYTGISFFRQLPAGVPGAYRLLANLISNP